MIEKLSLEQFRKIKQELIDILVKKDESTEVNNDIDKSIMDDYLKIQSDLLSYDLSEIPFEEWQGLSIFSYENNIVDFSKTKANIDFDIIKFSGIGDFSGCSVRNLEKLGRFFGKNIFDDIIIKNNPSLFLSDSFTEEFKDKYYKCEITMDDLAVLSENQIEELKQKNLYAHCNKDVRAVDNRLEIDKAIALYKYSKEDFKLLAEIENFDFQVKYYNYYFKDNSESLFTKLKESNVEDIKNVIFSHLRKSIMLNKQHEINLDELPELFVKENGDILLTDDSIPKELKERYYKRELTLDDVINNIDLFDNIAVEYFINSYDIMIVKDLVKFIGFGDFQKILKRYPDTLKYSVENFNSFYFCSYYEANDNPYKVFEKAVKEYFLDYGMPDDFKTVDTEGMVSYNVPEWLKPMNFSFIEKLETFDDLIKYNDLTVILDKKQRDVINLLGFDNIKKIEDEIQIFSHKSNEFAKELEMFRALTTYMDSIGFNERKELYDFVFKSDKLPYNEFRDAFATLLVMMRKQSIFNDFPDYDWIKGNFRDEHPKIFIDTNAPEELKQAFYKNNITPEFLYDFPSYIPYLVDKDVKDIIKNEMIPLEPTSAAMALTYIYSPKLSTEKILKIFSKYGKILSRVTENLDRQALYDDQILEKQLCDAINSGITESRSNIDYAYLANVPEFKNRYPELFIDLKDIPNISIEEKNRLESAFYNRCLSYEDVRRYPVLKTILKDKELKIPFGYLMTIYKPEIIPSNLPRVSSGYYSSVELSLLEAFGNEKFLELCSKFGLYFLGIVNSKNNFHFNFLTSEHIYYGTENLKWEKLSFEGLDKKIEETIIKECINGKLAYHPDDAPDFLKEKHPELFLDVDAPEELKKYFYNYGNNYPLTFKYLHENKEWLSYLEGKAIKTSLLRKNYLREDMMEFFEKFGEEKAIKLGITRTETVNEMLRKHKVDLMKTWYDKTGQKFIPDFVVMLNFPTDEIDKFIVSSVNWSNLMRIKSFSETLESREILLKLAYTFGVFDNDRRGFKQLLDLLTSIPRSINENQGYILEFIDGQINEYSQKEYFVKDDKSKDVIYQDILDYMKSIEDTGVFDKDILIKFWQSLKDEMDIDFSKDIMIGQIYRKNEDGSYTLRINQQSCPKTFEIIRYFFEGFNEFPIFTADNAHHYLGGFKLSYDPEFREFFLNNLQTIFENDEYLGNISQIQRRFSEIKTMYSNVTLTLDLACSYIQDNRYENINVGNEEVARVAAINKYDQDDFETLQQIYNYGRQRTFSSIPRVENKNGKYTYEMLRLDDPFAMAVGSLTDCCQELGDAAEVCMEHSMVDKNGRVFVVRDELGGIVAQSWVWRNKDVLCFDNIEVPDKQMWKHGIPRGQEDSGIRNEFTDEVLDVYKQAAYEIFEADQKIFKDLLEIGKITQEQYEGLRLGKITIGEGYSNIKGSFKTLKKDTEIARPLPFDEPVILSRSLYTPDSMTQYILEEREDRKQNDIETLSVYNDEYIEYDDSNFKLKNLLALEKLEIETKGNAEVLHALTEYPHSSKSIVSDIAYEYRLDSENTKIIMNPNFAIIYELDGDVVKIADLFFVTKIDNKNQQLDIEKVVMMQIKLALEQIAKGKKIDVSSLNDEQKDMYTKAINLNQEIDIERGIGHAR